MTEDFCRFTVIRYQWCP